MAKSKTRQNHGASWSDLTRDVLILIMMKMGVVDFLAFSRVCKSWRSVAFSNKNMFMEFRQPMSVWISRRVFREHCCYLQDSDGRCIKRSLPHSRGRAVIGVSNCGYLILFGKKTHDFWLVNPISRHGIHFPAFSYRLNSYPGRARAILVFSPSISSWVFVSASSRTIWFSIAGEGAWNHVTSDYPIIHLHAFKGKIYIITRPLFRVCELRLNPLPKLMFLETKNLPDVSYLSWEMVSSGENLYVTGNNAQDEYTVWNLDTCEMNWVQLKNTIRHTFYLHQIGYVYFPDKVLVKGNFSNIWYFPCDCLSV